MIETLERGEGETMFGRQMRATVRLKAGDRSGSVMLRRLNAPIIMCDLLDISELGCRCVARVRINDWSDSEKWREMLRNGELYEAEITFDPYIPFIRLPIEIRSSIAVPADGYELGLAFFDIEPDHRAMLKKAMMAMATEKIKTSKGVLKSDTPAAQPALAAAQLAASRLSAFKRVPVAKQQQHDVLKLGEVLSKSGKLTPPEVANAITGSRETGEKLGDYLVREGVLSHKDVLQARSVQTGLPYFDLDMSKVDPELLTLFPFSKMKALGFVPFEADEKNVRIASGNPLLKLELAELERICGKKVEPFLCREEIPRSYLEAMAKATETTRRSHPRFKVSLPVAFQCCTAEGTFSDTVFRGRTLDISQGGVQVTGPAILGMDPDEIAQRSLKMVITIGAVPQDIVGVCEARHVHLVRGSGGGTSCVYGLKLNQMSTAHRDILNSMISRIDRAQPAESDEDPASSNRN